MFHLKTQCSNNTYSLFEQYVFFVLIFFSNIQKNIHVGSHFAKLILNSMLIQTEKICCTISIINTFSISNHIK
jgi:hypothetical protein